MHASVRAACVQHWFHLGEANTQLARTHSTQFSPALSFALVLLISFLLSLTLPRASVVSDIAKKAQINTINAVRRFETTNHMMEAEIQQQWLSMDSNAHTHDNCEACHCNLWFPTTLILPPKIV